MLDAIQTRIVNALLDKYERSRFFRYRIQPTRRIMLDFYHGGKSEFPFYDIEQSDRRLSVNRALAELATMELLSYEWMQGEREHIVARVWLRMEHLDAAYKAVGREAKGEAIDRICAEIEAVMDRVQAPWAAAYLREAHEETLRKRRVAGGMPEDGGERDLLLRAIEHIDRLGGEEWTERVFSLRAFGDSKAFERSPRARILRILRKFFDADDDAADEDVLRQVGIVKYPEQFEFCGEISVWLHGHRVAFGHLSGGGVLYSTDFADCRLEIGAGTESVITIENRANYIDYIQKTKSPKALAIYHGGQFSPRKKAFLQAVAAALPEACAWYHWSDIDYGGLLMLARLRREIVPDAAPYRMNRDELARFRHFAAPISKAYAKKLEGLKARTELADCMECIDFMLEQGIRLEQEAMLV